MKLEELKGQIMGCGGCGHQSFSIARTARYAFMVQCQKCESISVIKQSDPELVIEWGPQGDGILCEAVAMSQKGT